MNTVEDLRTELHIALIRAVNESKTLEQHTKSEAYLDGWRQGVKSCGITLSMCDSDNYYLSQGIDRPMCCGVWLDWKPN
jgi:hypothetical protein